MVSPRPRGWSDSKARKRTIFAAIPGAANERAIRSRARVDLRAMSGPLARPGETGIAGRARMLAMNETNANSVRANRGCAVGRAFPTGGDWYRVRARPLQIDLHDPTLLERRHWPDRDSVAAQSPSPPAPPKVRQIGRARKPTFGRGCIARTGWPSSDSFRRLLPPLRSREAPTSGMTRSSGIRLPLAPD